MKRITNKWQILFHFKRDLRTLTLGWKEFAFGIVNIQTFPGEAMILTKDHYKGFIIRFMVWLPFDKAF